MKINSADLVSIADELTGVEVVLRDTAILMYHLSNNDLSVEATQAMSRSIQINLEVYADDLNNLIEHLTKQAKQGEHDDQPQNTSNR